VPHPGGGRRAPAGGARDERPAALGSEHQVLARHARKVTSAIHSPRLDKNIALAIVSADCAEIGRELEVLQPAGTMPARVVERPFYDPKKSLATA